MGLLLTFLCSITWAQSLPPFPGVLPAVLALLNAERAQMNLPALELSPALNPLEQAHVDDMAQGRVLFGHGGFSLRCQAARADLPGANNCGEIVAWGQKTPEAVVKSWMNSPHHHDAILDPAYTLAGVGISEREDGRRYWGVLFLKR